MSRSGTRIEKKRQKERENDREKRETNRKAKVLGDSLLDREFFGGGRLWFYAIS